MHQWDSCLNAYGDFFCYSTVTHEHPQMSFICTCIIDSYSNSLWLDSTYKKSNLSNSFSFVYLIQHLSIILSHFVRYVSCNLAQWQFLSFPTFFTEVAMCWCVIYKFIVMHMACLLKFRFCTFFIELKKGNSSLFRDAMDLMNLSLFSCTYCHASVCILEYERPMTVHLATRKWYRSDQE